MKLCSRCGARIPDGELFCPECGQEVQLVPDYETMGSRFQQEEERKKEEAERRRQEEEKKAEEERQKKKKATVRSVIILAAAAAAFAIIIFFVRSCQEQQNYNSFDYQLAKAETAYSNSDYDAALEYVTRAISLDGENLDARMLLALIHDKNGRQDEAVAELLSVIDDHPDYEPAYSQLIRIYEEQGETDRIKELLNSCRSEEVLEKFSDYICNAPEFSLKEGEYDTLQKLTIRAAEGTVIYYSTDGSDPDTSSDRYFSAIQIPEGRTVVKAVAVNERGIVSDITEAEYTVSLKIPSRPVITPASGSYTSKTVKEITVDVPEGYTAYYAFDRRPDLEDTENTLRYTGPVEMMEGAHTFYAVLVNRNGQAGPPSSATYVYKTEPTPTPTPAETPEPTPTERPPVTQTPEVTPEVTPETTPEATTPSGPETQDPQDAPEENQDPETDPSEEPGTAPVPSEEPETTTDFDGNR